MITLLLLPLFFEKMLSLPDDNVEVLRVDLKGVEETKLDSFASEPIEVFGFVVLDINGKTLCWLPAKNLDLRETCKGVDWLRIGARGSLWVKGVTGTKDLL